MPNPADDDIHSTQLGEDPNTGTELDKLFAEVTVDPNASAVVEDDKPKTDDTVVDDKPKSDEPVVDGLPTEQPEDDKPVENTSGSRVPSTDDAPAAEVVIEDPVLKLIEEYKLKDGASAKSKETFENLKRLSAEAVRLEKEATARRVAEYEAKLAEVAKKAEEATPSKMSEEVEKELAELRGFKATFDIENDPEFKKQIEAKVEPRKASNYEAIYGVLKSHSLPESELKVLKEMPEAERIAAIGDLMDKLPRGPSRMKVEAKLMDNLNLDDERERAIAEAREKASKVKQEFRVAPEKQKEQTLAAVKADAEKYRANPIFKKVEVNAQTPAEERKRIEVQNAKVEKITKLFDEVIADDSPAARAEAAFGLALAHHFKAQLDEVSEMKGKLEKELADIKKRGNLSDVGKITNTPAPKNTDIATFDAGDSLDALARQAGIIS